MTAAGWAEPLRVAPCSIRPKAARPPLFTPALQVVRRALTRRLLGQAARGIDEGHSGAVTLIRRSR